MDIGRKLKDLRVRKGLTQEELADRAELTKGFISQLERNLTSPSIATLMDILQCLGTNIGDFFNEETEEQVVFSKGDYFEKLDGELKNKIQWIIPNAQKNVMEPILLTLEPGGNVMTGERYKMVPDEFKKLARGEFGRTPQPVNPEVLEKCGIKEEDLVTCRPADLLEPGMDKFKAELAAKGFPNASEEDVLSYALFPAVAEEFFKKRTVKTLKELGVANPTDEDVLLYNLDAEVAKKFFAAK